MTQNKYVVGKKYKINSVWNGYEDAIVKVASIKPSYCRTKKKIEVEYGSGETSWFLTTSVIDDHTTPYEEEKTIVTEKVTKVIEAGEYGHVWVDNFEVGVDKHITIEVNSNVFTKQTLGDLIKTLNEIHEVM